MCLAWCLAKDLAINSDQLSILFCFFTLQDHICDFMSVTKVRVQITDLQRAAKLAGVQRLLRARLDLLS